MAVLGFGFLQQQYRAVTWGLSCLICALTFLTSARAGERGEFVFSVFTAGTLSQDGDMRVRQPGGTDLTLHDVSYDGRDFSLPPYYGGRLTYFLSETSHWGFGAEFFHAKLYLDTEKNVPVTGSRAGVPVDAIEPVNNTVPTFVLHNGMNFITADVFYRWLPGHRGEDFLGRFQPYVGLGAGVVVPYVQSQLAGGAYQSGYQWGGPGLLGMTGLNFDLTRHLSLFAEYKISYARLDDLGVSGGTINLDPLTHHFSTGISLRF